MVLEGPIITVISGLLVNLGVLNIFATYGLLVLADLMGDALHYVIGVYWRRALWIKKYGRFLGYNEQFEGYIDVHFQKHKIKTFLVAKFSHGLGTAIQIAAGVARVNFFEYLWVNFAATIPKTAIFLFIGFYMGDSYQLINKYLTSFGWFLVMIAVFAIVILVSNKYARKFFAKDEDIGINKESEYN